MSTDDVRTRHPKFLSTQTENPMARLRAVDVDEALRDETETAAGVSRQLAGIFGYLCQVHGISPDVAEDCAREAATLPARELAKMDAEHPVVDPDHWGNRALIEYAKNILVDRGYVLNFAGY